MKHTISKDVSIQASYGIDDIIELLENAASNELFNVESVCLTSKERKIQSESARWFGILDKAIQHLQHAKSVLENEGE